MLIQAVKAWARHERQVHRFHEVFGTGLTRKDRRRIGGLMRRLLAWHIERGHTLTTVENMVDEDYDGVNKELREIGTMLTATTLPADLKRYLSLVSRIGVVHSNLKIPKRAPTGRHGIVSVRRIPITVLFGHVPQLRPPGGAIACRCRHCPVSLVPSPRSRPASRPDP